MMSPKHPEDDAGEAQAPVSYARVLAAVICRDRRYLVCRRPEHKRHGRLWEFPGGKIHPGETLAEAARRELAEELALEVVSVGPLLFTRKDPDSPYIIEFLEVTTLGEPQRLEHDELRWLTHGQIVALELAPADRAFAQEVLPRLDLRSRTSLLLEQP